jgi:hypothetical protein
MFKFFKRIWMGAGYLEGYGEHPGTLHLCAFILCSGLAGAERSGWEGFLFGALFCVAVTLPFYLGGCYSRALDYEKDVERTFNILKDKNL